MNTSVLNLHHTTDSKVARAILGEGKNSLFRDIAGQHQRCQGDRRAIEVELFEVVYLQLTVKT